MEFARPTTVDEAVSLLAAGEWDVLSGGTDYFPGLRDEPPTAPILDISAIAGLRGIERTVEGWRIGALATWTDIIRADLPAAFDGLKAASREVGSVQVQNRATLAGNLCNASPAADGVPPLLTLEAQVELASPDGHRRLPLDAFILGNRKTALGAGEFVTGILVPDSASRGSSAFLKLGARKYLVISIAMVAVRLVIEGGHIIEAAIAVGSCSEVAKRLSGLEAQVIGQTPDDAAAQVSPNAVAELSPISDVRAPDTYRREAAVEILRRVISMAAA